MSLKTLFHCRRYVVDSVRVASDVKITSFLVNRELADAAQRRWADASCSLTRWHHFSPRNGVMANILRVCRRYENSTPSIDAYLLEEPNFITKTRSDLKETTEPWAFFKRSPQREEKKNKNKNKNNNKMSSDLRSVPALKTLGGSSPNFPAKV